MVALATHDRLLVKLFAFALSKPDQWWQAAVRRVNTSLAGQAGQRQQQQQAPECGQ
jgi:hypothetical protein